MAVLHNVPAFTVTAFAIVAIPGPNALFIIGRSLARGRRGSVLTVAGDALGLLPQIALMAIGVGAVVAASPPLLLTVRLAGAAYLACLGTQAIGHRRAGLPGPESAMAGTEASASAVRTRTHPAAVLRQGFVIEVTNPKSTVLFIAVLPQFVDPANGPVPLPARPGLRVRRCDPRRRDGGRARRGLRP
ncbi:MULTISPECIES: LysE family translocator [Streptomyces]|uniref:LysE family translocator n=1 Tax=Streptomyces TaxID=1883 RepID=UPI0016722D95|nr:MULTISPECIES: LysE family translocator [Streptomyces]MBK3521161.1 LysE family translocator [Streptomyces sp. MBT70]